MDDLSGLDWSSSSNTNKTKTAAATNAPNAPYAYPSLRPTPSPLGSGRNTPISMQGSSLPSGLGGMNRPAAAAAAVTAAAPAPAKPAQDSFSGLIHFGSSSSKNPAKMTLLERQELLNAEKRRKQEQQQAAYGSGLDMLGRVGSASSRTASPAIPSPSPAPTPQDDGDDALFAAFKADTKVDQASYYPPSPGSGPSTRQPTQAHVPSAALDLGSPSAWTTKPAETKTSSTSSNNNNDDDDDPFGLSAFQAKTTAAAHPAATATTTDEDFDFLGDLGRPVEEVRREAEEKQRREREQQQRERERERERERQRQQQSRSARQPSPGKPIEDADTDSDASTADAAPPPTGNPALDKAVAQLVDYGFSARDAQRGLAHSGRGTDVQAAVNWLLDDAHRQAKAKARQQGGESGPDFPEESRRPTGRTGSAARTDSRSPAAASAAAAAGGGGVLGDGDFAKTAAVVGSQLFKTANSLWKTGQKRMQKAVQEFQQDGGGGGDPNQPRWMRDAGLGQGQDRFAAPAAAAAATDEAMMLEAGGRPERRKSPAPSSQTASRTNSPVPHWQQQQQQQQRQPSPAQRQQPSQQRGAADPRVRLTKQALEEETAQAYVSPARRRQRTPVPVPAAATAQTTRMPDAVPEGDLLNSTALPQRPAAAARPSPRSSAAARPLPTAAPTTTTPRRVPPVPAGVMEASAQHRAAGAAHVKRGDYAAAHAAYAAALAGVPDDHPVRAVVLSNRALTALKTGEPRQAVADADAALAVIGPGRGVGEAVALADGTGATRDLGELYGKVLTRKAEALEQMEKWAEAGAVWQQCVEAGVGGATALAGRQRCQGATAKSVAKPPAARPVQPSAPKPSKPTKPTTATATSASGQDFEAVARLRAANAAAEREDAEKLALTDQVDARIAAWRDGKRENLRALLGSMDAVLWAGSGWKPVGLHELVLPNRVKVAYMRAIAKTHPDKLPQDASTEVRMVAATVFATLNESWDRFKADNKM